jgi:plastocyanin
MSRSRSTRVLSLAAAVCLLFAACSPDPGGSADEVGAAAQNGAVEMADIAFTPASVTITTGSTVTWTNNDTVPHTVAFSDEAPQSSETVDPGGTFEATFAEAGSYAYVCTLHPGMEGVVEVAAAEAAAGAAPDATSSDGTSTSGLAAVGASGAVAAGEQLPGAGTTGVDIAQGEWALVSSALEAPPGTITFRFRNLGTVPHALRIRTSGSGRDRLEWRAEAVAPGESGLLVVDLASGTYDLDCPIEDAHGEHDQLGMEMRFSVYDGAAELAPLSGVTDSAPGSSGTEASGAAVAIAAFAFAPTDLRVPVGTTVAWSNSDPTPHTVTGDAFDTGALEQGTTGTVTFDTAGTFEYFCAIHPTMRGRVVVGS